jgi:hypothetical protein
MNAKLANFILVHPFGFLTDSEVPLLIAIDPLCLLLVRCQQCRFLAPANQLQHIITALEFAGDYVRDVSFPDELIQDARNSVNESHSELTTLHRRD